MVSALEPGAAPIAIIDAKTMTALRIAFALVIATAEIWAGHATPEYQSASA